MIVLELLGRRPVRIVGAGETPGPGAVQDHRPGTFGVRGCEQQAQRPALRDPEDRRAVGPDGVHDGADVVHPLVHRRWPGHRVRHPGAALVEHDQPRERRQPAQEASQARFLPGHLDVRDEARHQDEIDRTVAEHLVGDADRPALRIARLGRCHHAPPSPQWDAASIEAAQGPASSQHHLDHGGGAAHADACWGWLPGLGAAMGTTSARMTTGVVTAVLVVGLSLGTAGAAAAAPGATTSRVSVSSSGAQGFRSSEGAALSGEGRYVAFASLARTLFPATRTWSRTCSSVTGSRVSPVACPSVQAVGRPTGPARSLRSRPTAATSPSCPTRATSSPVTPTTPRTSSYATASPARTRRVSIGQGGQAGQRGEVVFPALSGDGLHVAFQSAASNLVPGDTNGTFDIFVRDLLAGTTPRVSLGPAGVQGDGASLYPAVSRNGRFVAFTSEATNLVVGGPERIHRCLRAGQADRGHPAGIGGSWRRRGGQWQRQPAVDLCRRSFRGVRLVGDQPGAGGHQRRAGHLRT